MIKLVSVETMFQAFQQLKSEKNSLGFVLVELNKICINHAILDIVPKYLCKYLSKCILYRYAFE